MKHWKLYVVIVIVGIVAGSYALINAQAKRINTLTEKNKELTTTVEEQKAINTDYQVRISGQAVGSINLDMHQNQSYNFRSQIATSYSRSGRLFFRAALQNGWNDWREVLHTVNTTTDPQGFIKKTLQ